DERVLVERRGHLLLIGLNRPHKRNAADLAMLHQLAQAYTLLHTDAELRVGVVHAVGEHFTGGLDLADVGPALASGSAELLPPGTIDPWGVATEPVAKPVVFAVQGTCLTLGVELALASDVVVAAAGTRFAQLEVSRGIMAFGGATLRLPRLGWGDAMRWLLTGDSFDAAEALRIGLVQQVVPDGDQLDAAVALAERIAAQAPLAVQATLANARLALTDPRAAVGRLHPVVAMLARTSDAQRAIAGYLGGQRVDFTGN
ncbi:MAG TPA: crotonase/enoyl-CoA hydratase family protein, partial [Micropruina sp.]|nr:crotonase/enoyl-CoA hydratase family protein [Micropruina sp.]HMR23235.1 crotonase/enoyl-CoA hydratase family protein [Micropruina sp.]